MAMQFLWRRLNLLLLLVVVLGLQACSLEKLTAEETFNRAVAGLAGVGNLSFRGNAVFISGDREIDKQSVAFQGQLEDYKKLTITTSKSPLALGEFSTKLPDRLNLYGIKETMKYDGSKWNYIAATHERDDWLSGLNPLEQLQYIGKSDKKITEESGAPSGTKKLRIELSPETSLGLLKETLNGQMRTLRHRMDQQGDILYTHDPNVKDRLLAIWEKEKEELNRLLERSAASTVLYLTIDKKTYLPESLSSERIISVKHTSGLSKDESLKYETLFMEYR